MATATRPGPFAPKPTEHLVRETSGEHGLKRAVGVLDLTALGIGAIIGTGIFVIIGEAIGDSGPSIILSFVARRRHVRCSPRSPTPSWRRRSRSPAARTRTATRRSASSSAWIIGWDLILEYGVSVAAVAVGWGSTSRACSTRCSASRCPTRSRRRPGDGGTVNLPAVVLVLA